MKKFLLISLMCASVLRFPIISFAQGWEQENENWVYYNNDGTLKTGWFYDVINNGRYYFDENGTMVTNSWVETDRKRYYLGEDGKMLFSTITPDGIQVDRNGVGYDPLYIDFENVKDDSLSFIKDGVIITVPCKIHYHNKRKGKYTTIKYESVGIEEFNGEKPKLSITYSVIKTGGYGSTFLTIDIYVNGNRQTSLGGNEGDIWAKFNENSVVTEIPYDFLTSSDTVDIYIHG